MTIKQFIEKAIEGGWKPPLSQNDIIKNWKFFHGVEYASFKLVEESTGDEFTLQKSIAGILLDPLAWQAVGKVEGWNRRMMLQVYRDTDGEHSTTVDCAPEWKYHMHRMIDALAEGKTIEEFWKTI